MNTSTGGRSSRFLVFVFLLPFFCLRGWGIVLYSGGGGVAFLLGVRFFERERGWVCVCGLG